MKDGNNYIVTVGGGLHTSQGYRVDRKYKRVLKSTKDIVLPCKPVARFVRRKIEGKILATTTVPLDKKLIEHRSILLALPCPEKSLYQERSRWKEALWQYGRVVWKFFESWTEERRRAPLRTMNFSPAMLGRSKYLHGRVRKVVDAKGTR